jgi:hypothetical protein
MRHPDVQYLETVGRDMFDNVALHGEGKFQLAQAGLDRQLPYTHEAYQTLVFPIGKHCTGFWRQSPIPFHPPQKGVRVDNDAHQT